MAPIHTWNNPVAPLSAWLDPVTAGHMDRASALLARVDRVPTLVARPDPAYTAAPGPPVDPLDKLAAGGVLSCALAKPELPQRGQRLCRLVNVNETLAMKTPPTPLVDAAIDFPEWPNLSKDELRKLGERIGFTCGSSLKSTTAAGVRRDAVRAAHVREARHEEDVPAPSLSYSLPPTFHGYLAHPAPALSKATMRLTADFGADNVPLPSFLDVDDGGEGSDLDDDDYEAVDKEDSLTLSPPSPTFHDYQLAPLLSPSDLPTTSFGEEYVRLPWAFPQSCESSWWIDRLSPGLRGMRWMSSPYLFCPSSSASASPVFS
ncbi:hypothetical protein BDK51DRAFT_34045 [Blyttiomyces helicus]|uniref:Uncharacterized protein n=1 Tax=Blyttiomyces helicus TaxID=388810 RepID=A0A4P9WE70_9FUNG|nr:hypothetical protein BDK51DRAFT_34045 [Blyttiomyces helicus]|eukprot:RKO90884.1 hypothetical protein BDK51DRAFT_34045 [Blyttiomyces helicus]